MLVPGVLPQARGDIIWLTGKRTLQTSDHHKGLFNDIIFYQLCNVILLLAYIYHVMA